MRILRKAAERGHFDMGWLDTWHTFSFGEYLDRKWMGFRALRVINEDWVRPGQGFGRHPHRDMEILTYVLSGSVRHDDSMGNGGIVAAGEIQRMTAGRGVFHSEANPSASETLHLLQIWIQPERAGLEPGYEQRSLRTDDLTDRLAVIASREGGAGAVRINADATVLAGRLRRGLAIEHRFAAERHGWLHVVKGRVKAAGEPLGAGDGMGVSGEDRLALVAEEDVEVLLFDLA